MDDGHVLSRFYKNGRLHLYNNPMTSDEKEYLYKRYPEDEFVSFKETLRRIKFGVEECPRCLECGKKIPILDNQNKPHTYCSKECKLKSEAFREKCKKTMIDKYGVENAFQTKASIDNQEKSRSRALESRRKTCLEKYGVEYPLQSQEVRDKINQINIEKYGSKCSIDREKTKKTWMSKYGVENPSKSDVVKKTKVSHNIKKYGVDHAFQNEDVKEKMKSTWMSKYGVDHPMKSLVTKEKSKTTCLNIYGCSYVFQDEGVKEKIKSTCIDRYGVDNWMKSDDAKTRMSYILSSPEVLRKEYLTKKKNNSFNSSKPEDMCYDILKEKFPDCIRHYSTDPRYPFDCDFYIPSLDLFIEYNGHWTHGRHAFRTEKDDDSILRKWQSKSGDFYKNAIDTWTRRDVLKRETAKKNNLNYIELWSLDEAKRLEFRNEN